jgi:putative ABC transport system substrate-binding protein
MADELDGKRLELLKEAVPQLTRVVFLRMRDRAAPVGPKELEVAGKVLGLQVQAVEVQRPEDFDIAFSAITKERANALLITRGPFVRTHAARITDFANKRRLPTMWEDKLFVEAGGLMSYGTDFVDLYYRAATYVDKILKGTKPADLPVERPTKFEFIINLKTAKQIGLTIPPNVLARANRVIR